MNATLTHRALSAYEDREAERALTRMRMDDLARQDARRRWLDLLGEHIADSWRVEVGKLTIVIDGLTLTQHYGRPRGFPSLRHYLLLQGDPEGKPITMLESLGAAITRRNARS